MASMLALASDPCGRYADVPRLGAHRSRGTIQRPDSTRRLPGLTGWHRPDAMRTSYAPKRGGHSTDW
jgi:hypothetical protein